MPDTKIDIPSRPVVTDNPLVALAQDPRHFLRQSDVFLYHSQVSLPIEKMHLKIMQKATCPKDLPCRHMLSLSFGNRPILPLLTSGMAHRSPRVIFVLYDLQSSPRFERLLTLVRERRIGLNSSTTRVFHIPRRRPCTRHPHHPCLLAVKLGSTVFEGSENSSSLLPNLKSFLFNDFRGFRDHLYPSPMSIFPAKQRRLFSTPQLIISPTWGDDLIVMKSALVTRMLCADVGLLLHIVKSQ